MVKRIGFVGLGAMGAPMARNLLKSGFHVQGFDLRASARQGLVEAGGVAAESAAAAAKGAEVLMLMVVSAAQAETVLFNDGALAALPPGAIVALTATCPPRTVELLATRVENAGCRFVDAPVSGGTAGAEAATLTMMVAAADATFAELKPVLETVGEKVFHVGTEPGQGAVVKTLNQLLCGVHIVAAAEALSLAAKVGVDPGVVLEIVGGSAAASWMLNDRGPRMLQAEPAVRSAVDIFVKDLGIVLEAGRDAKVALPLAAAAHQLFLAASGHGDGAADDSQVIRSYQRLNGQP